MIWALATVVIFLLCLLCLYCYLFIGYRYAKSRSQRLLADVNKEYTISPGFNPRMPQFQARFRRLQWFWLFYCLSHYEQTSEYDQAVYNSLEERKKRVKQAEIECEIAQIQTPAYISQDPSKPRLLQRVRGK